MGPGHLNFIFCIRYFLKVDWDGKKQKSCVIKSLGKRVKKRGRRLEGKEQKGKAGNSEVKFLFDVIT